jgi:hypothetical protein
MPSAPIAHEAKKQIKKANQKREKMHDKVDKTKENDAPFQPCPLS